ncbi:MAG TPA: MBL fold metallo-hydrolase [Planctomycetota bacterium]|nr:MBL fold metallo-hydrolase [Planctomycetota bacterium]
MDLGFETIGNATLIVHDVDPVLSTDPWVEGTAYFGSWSLSHEVPAEQQDAIRRAPFVWFSHGHPDHLNPDCLPRFLGQTILLADHVGGRVRNDLARAGFDVKVLPDRRWVSLSDRVHVLSVADYNQDSILLVDVGGVLLINLNDASDRGWSGLVRKTARRYGTCVLLALTGSRDTDMINLFDEAGRRIAPVKGPPTGLVAARLAAYYGATHFIPFSAMHRYQRQDSVWASAYTTRLEDYAEGFASPACQRLPAFVRFDALRGTWEEIGPAPIDSLVADPKAFGDDWSERLERDEKERAATYFQRVGHLATFLEFVNLRVGRSDNVIPLGPARSGRGITFEVPRASLMTAVDNAIFDDLLIGNFMRTTLHGDWPASGLYPDFTPYVSKYADNGGARSEAELESYFLAYRRRDPLAFFRHRIEEVSKNLLRTRLDEKALPFRVAKRVYWGLKAAT